MWPPQPCSCASGMAVFDGAVDSPRIGALEIRNPEARLGPSGLRGSSFFFVFFWNDRVRESPAEYGIGEGSHSSRRRSILGPTGAAHGRVGRFHGEWAPINSINSGHPRCHSGRDLQRRSSAGHLLARRSGRGRPARPEVSVAGDSGGAHVPDWLPRPRRGCSRCLSWLAWKARRQARGRRGEVVAARQDQKIPLLQRRRRLGQLARLSCIGNC